MDLEEAENGRTRVLLESDVALGGMLGSVGQKVVAKQASVVTKSFARALEQELSGGAGEAGEPAVGVDAAEPPPSSPGPSPETSSARKRSASHLALVGLALLGMLLILRRVRSR